MYGNWTGKCHGLRQWVHMMHLIQGFFLHRLQSWLFYCLLCTTIHWSLGSIFKNKINKLLYHFQLLINKKEYIRVWTCIVLMHNLCAQTFDGLLNILSFGKCSSSPSLSYISSNAVRYTHGLQVKSRRLSKPPCYSLQMLFTVTIWPICSSTQWGSLCHVVPRRYHCIFTDNHYLIIEI